MIAPSPRNPHSHLTVKDRRWPSYPTRHLLAQGRVRGRVLDFGCGTGTDVAFLREQGIDITGYDPHYAPAWPTGRFDTILCQYVLNVLLPEEQVQVLMAVAELLEPAGHAYFTVRRDIKCAGFRSHTEYDGAKVYQCNVVLPYRSVLAVEHCEIYEYRPYNQMSHQGADDCPFCHPTATQQLLSESATVYALLDHTAPRALIIPKIHIASYFDLPQKLRTACWLMVDRVRWLLAQRDTPDGWQIEMETGKSVPHATIVLSALWRH